MTPQEKTEREPREFWLAKPDLDFDLNWKQIHAAEFPHVSTKVDTLHVIEKSAYDSLLLKLQASEQRSAELLKAGYELVEFISKEFSSHEYKTQDTSECEFDCMRDGMIASFREQFAAHKAKEQR